jgi:hypothetical protein
LLERASKLVAGKGREAGTTKPALTREVDEKEENAETSTSMLKLKKMDG